ncbi:hypothetical protein M3226_02630 [Neobacillus cucumis]|uniref:hypothetical protein n=1 Tax=Neobacillus cucumis TaxID=1740721 RepID=UPI00203FBD20|nr:hypothetical protein [Neobacillus cucumis]MCM3724597.1 hypothetical protein [Neobacillus cucumis]
MTKLITVRRAKEEVERLQEYIDLAELYEAETLDKLIIKEYAFSNSIAEVVRVLYRRGIQLENEAVSKEYVKNVIKSKAKDELHRILQTGYFIKTRHSRSLK